MGCRLAFGLCQSVLLLLTLPVKVTQHGICYATAQAYAHAQKILDVKDDITKDEHAQPCGQDVLHLACNRGKAGSPALAGKSCLCRQWYRISIKPGLPSCYGLSCPAQLTIMTNQGHS